MRGADGPGMRRILTAAILLLLFWVVIKRAPAWAFFVVAGVCISLATWECYGLLETRGGRPFKALGLFACLALVWSFSGLEPTFGASLPLIALTLIGVVAALWKRDEPSAMLETALHTLFPVFFVGLTLAYLVALRTFPGEEGEDLLMLLLVCVVSSDTVAYYVGTLLGRHRMTPRLSPKKSWEGALGGVAASVVAALVAHFWFYQRLQVRHAVAIGILLAVAGILGDLAESMVKRAAGVKDSSSLLPGHGGMLDRADSLLFAGPVFYYYYTIFLEGAW